MSNINSRTVILALALVSMSVVAPIAMAAAPSLDNETTSTSTTTDVSEGSALQDFNASSSNHTYIEYTADTNNSSVEIQDPNSSVTYYTNTSAMTTNASAGYYAVNFSHDELERVPVEANENKTVEVVITNSTEVDNPDTYTFNVTLAADGSRTVVDLNEHVAADDNAFSAETVGLFNIAKLSGIVGDHEVTDLSQDNLAVDGSNTTVTVYLSNTTAQDSFSSATDGTEAGTIDVDLQTTMDTGSDEETVAPIFVDEAPASSDIPDGATYGVYHSDSNKVVYHLGDDFDGKSNIDTLTVKSGDAWSWSQTLSLSRDYGMGLIGQKAMPGVGSLF